MSTIKDISAPARPHPLRETRNVATARRTMEICNACRYCEGFCPVFPAMARRRQFSLHDLAHLANLCHNCKGCWYACQYAPPHEFGLNLPKVFAELRVETYTAFSWPRTLGRLFERNGLWLSLISAGVMALTLIGTMAFTDAGVLTAVHRGEGAFYAVIPHGTMVLLGGVTFAWAAGAMIVGGLGYWRACGGTDVRPGALVQALREAAVTRHLGGAGEGCNDIDARFGMGRRHFHTATVWGFMLCFAATCLGTAMHYLLGWQAPYGWYSAPVISGTVGGVLLTVGTAGLFCLKIVADREPAARRHYGMDYALLALLFWVAVSGLALLFLRQTAAMGVLLAVHLGFVLALFIALPYGKFVHGLYRIIAIARDVSERS